jgi:hypothetical protein
LSISEQHRRKMRGCIGARNEDDDLLPASAEASRLLSWPQQQQHPNFQPAESIDVYSWRDISIGSWPKTTSTNLMTPTTPDSRDWLNKLSEFPGNAVASLACSSTGRNSNASTNSFSPGQARSAVVSRNRRVTPKACNVIFVITSAHPTQAIFLVRVCLLCPL